MRTQNVSTFAPDVLPDSECRSYRQVLFSVLDSRLRPEKVHRDSDGPGTANAGTTTMATTSTSKPTNVHELRTWGLKQVTIGAIVGLSQGRVTKILSQGL